MIPKQVIFWSILLACITSCIKKQPPCPNFFLEYKNNWPKNCFIHIRENNQNKAICGYGVWFYDGNPEYFYPLNGIIYDSLKTIIYLSERPRKVKFTLFDFNMKIDDSILIKYVQSIQKNKKDSLVIKQYYLTLESRFFDTILTDTIFKFKFEKYKIFSEDDNLIYFVGQKVGIVGCYLSNRSNKDTVETIVGELCGNVYKQRFDYTKVKYRVIL